MNPRSTNCELDTLTTTPSHRLQWQGDSLHWQGTNRKAVHTIGGSIGMYRAVYTGGGNFFIKIDQSETTKSHMYNTSLKLINHKCLTTKKPPRIKCCWHIRVATLAAIKSQKQLRPLMKELSLFELMRFPSIIKGDGFFLLITI